jgi:hypothetical protein
MGLFLTAIGSRFVGPLAGLAMLAAPLAAQTVLNNVIQFGADDGAITPDGRYGVVRENTLLTTARVYDMATGQLVSSVQCTQGQVSSAAQDAVEVTNERAIVLGSSALVLDLTNLANPLLAEIATGFAPADVAITPDGTIGLIRGGSGSAGLYVIDMATGTVLATHAGLPSDPFSTSYAYNVDSVVATNDHAAFLSIVGPFVDARTKVTIFDLHPAGGGAPQVVFETTPVAQGPVHQAGAPHDLCLTPDGQYVAVRSEFSVGLYHLNGAATSRVFHERLWNHPGPFGGSAMDSIEATNDRVITTSRFTANTFGAQVDVFDLAGNRWSDRVRGDPHDLTLTPSGLRALVRTHLGVYLYDIANLPAGTSIEPIDRDETLVSTHTFYGAGYDSIRATNHFALAVARVNGSAVINDYDISNDTLSLRRQTSLPEKPVDVAISPDEQWATVVGTSYVDVFDFNTGFLALAYDSASDPIGWFPWCDGVELDNDHLLAWGYNDAQSGWVSVVDLFTQAANYCSAPANSTGQPGTLHATGTSSIAANNLGLVASHLPVGATGFFVYGTAPISVPFGNSTSCVGGQRYKMVPIGSNAGNALMVCNFNAGVGLGGAMTAGSTWYFQMRYRDPAAQDFKLTDALSIPITN